MHTKSRSQTKDHYSIIILEARLVRRRNGQLPVRMAGTVFPKVYTIHGLSPGPADFFWTRFENLVAKRRKINDRVVPILVAMRNWNDVIACQDPVSR